MKTQYYWTIRQLRKLKYSLVKRRIKYLWQRLTRGWDDSDTWSLDSTIAEFVLPRLIRFKELNNGHPGNLTWDEWNNILDDMIWSMQAIVDDKQYNYDKETDERIQKGLDLFGEYFLGLWW